MKEIVESSAGLSQRDKELEDRFIENLFIYRKPEEAALAAGYSETYAKSIVSRKRKSQRFIQKLKSSYNGNAVLILPEIFHSEASSIQLSNNIIHDLQHQIDNTDDINKKTELTEKSLSILAKAASTRKELKQTAGVLAQEGQTTVNLVNIEKIQAISQQIHADMLNNKADD